MKQPKQLCIDTSSNILDKIDIVISEDLVNKPNNTYSAMMDRYKRVKSRNKVDTPKLE